MAFSATQSFFAFFALGFLGSIHCVGMCSPLAACASSGRTKLSIDSGVVKYFFSRLLAYTTLGYFSGVFGKIIFVGQLQINTRWLWWIFVGVMVGYALREIALGIRVWFQGLKPESHKTLLVHSKTSWFAAQLLETLSRRLTGFSQSFTRWMMNKSGLPRGVALGIATALLPCGFLAMALVQAATLASPLESALGLSGFALGTSPALWGGAALLMVLRRVFPRSARLFFGVTMLLGSLMLVMRTNKISTPLLNDAPADQLGSPEKKLPCH